MFQYGDGTSANPYQIWTAEDLNDVRYYLNYSFKQMADIDLKTYGDWTPIHGSSWEEFTGTYDGNGFKIMNLTINNPTDHYNALFYFTNGAKLSNITLLDINILADDWGYNSGLVGYSTFTEFKNCKVSGTIRGWNNCGGITALDDNSTFYRCSFTGSIFCYADSVGGITSYTSFSNAEQCYSKCDLTAEVNIGGLFGTISDSIIKDSYTWGTITSTNTISTYALYCGGAIGNCSATNVTNIYSSTQIKLGIQTTENVGGLIGSSVNNSQIISSYYNIEVSGQTDTGKGIPITTLEMKTQVTFLNWDFVNIWGIYSGSSTALLNPSESWNSQIFQFEYDGYYYCTFSRGRDDGTPLGVDDLYMSKSSLDNTNITTTRILNGDTNSTCILDAEIKDNKIYILATDHGTVILSATPPPSRFPLYLIIFNIDTYSVESIVELAQKTYTRFNQCVMTIYENYIYYFITETTANGVAQFRAKSNLDGTSFVRIESFNYNRNGGLPAICVCNNKVYYAFVYLYATSHHYLYTGVSNLDLSGWSFSLRDSTASIKSDITMIDYNNTVHVFWQSGLTNSKSFHCGKINTLYNSWLYQNLSSTVGNTRSLKSLYLGNGKIALTWAFFDTTIYKYQIGRANIDLNSIVFNPFYDPTIFDSMYLLSLIVIHGSDYYVYLCDSEDGSYDIPYLIVGDGFPYLKFEYPIPIDLLNEYLSIVNYDRQNTNRISYKINSPFELKNKVEFNGDWIGFRYSPVIDNNGVIYMFTNYNNTNLHLYAVNSDGTIKYYKDYSEYEFGYIEWEISTDYSPLLLNNGYLYYMVNSKYLVCFNSVNGDVIWFRKFETGIFGELILDNYGHLIIPSDCLYSLNSDGTDFWVNSWDWNTRVNPFFTTHRPSIGKITGDIYIIDHFVNTSIVIDNTQCSLYRVNWQTGGIVWSHQFGMVTDYKHTSSTIYTEEVKEIPSHGSRPNITSDEKIIISSYYGNVYCFTMDGNLLWEKHLEEELYISRGSTYSAYIPLSIDSNGALSHDEMYVYFTETSNANLFLCLEVLTGTLINYFDYNTAYPSYAKMCENLIVDGNNNVYVATSLYLSPNPRFFALLKFGHTGEYLGSIEFKTPELLSADPSYFKIYSDGKFLSTDSNFSSLLLFGELSSLLFNWTYPKVAGENFKLSAGEWNRFTTTINEKRVAKGLSAYNFTYAVIGLDFSATIFNETINALNDLFDYWGAGQTLPVTQIQGNDIYAVFFEQLKNTLNSIN